jgi:hypothetical protein
MQNRPNTTSSTSSTPTSSPTTAPTARAAYRSSSAPATGSSAAASASAPRDDRAEGESARVARNASRNARASSRCARCRACVISGAAARSLVSASTSNLRARVSVRQPDARRRAPAAQLGREPVDKLAHACARAHARDPRAPRRAREQAWRERRAGRGVRLVQQQQRVLVDERADVRDVRGRRARERGRVEDEQRRVRVAHRVLCTRDADRLGGVERGRVPQPGRVRHAQREPAEVERELEHVARRPRSRRHDRRVALGCRARV